MALKGADEGREKMLGVSINGVANEDLTLKLYSNNHTPVNTDTAAAFTEATFTGYAAVTLTRGSWSIATVAGVTTATYALQTFTSTADQALQNAYGYYIVGATSGKLYWAELFVGGPFAVQFNGDKIRVTPSVNLNDA